MKKMVARIVEKQRGLIPQLVAAGMISEHGAALKQRELDNFEKARP